MIETCRGTSVRDTVVYPYKLKNPRDYMKIVRKVKGKCGRNVRENEKENLTRKIIHDLMQMRLYLSHHYPINHHLLCHLLLLVSIILKRSSESNLMIIESENTKQVHKILSLNLIPIGQSSIKLKLLLVPLFINPFFAF